MKRIILSILLLLCSSLLVLSCSDEGSSVNLALAGSTYTDTEGDTRLIFYDNNKARFIDGRGEHQVSLVVNVLNIKKVDDSYELNVDIFQSNEFITNLTENSTIKTTLNMTLDQNEVVILGYVLKKSW